MPKIVKLVAENVKRLRAVEITPKGHVVTVRGNNGQGKSSALDAIAMAIGGKSLHPAKVIREGEKEAVARLELDNGFTIERKWTSNDRSTLEIRGRDGEKVSSPQTTLDSLVSRATFDPVAFLSLDERKQVEALRRVVGLDFTELDDARKLAYDERTDVNRRVHHAKVRLEPLRDFSETEPVSLVTLTEEASALTAARGAQADAKRQLQVHAREVSAALSLVESQRATVARLQRDLDAAKVRLGELEGDSKRLESVDVSALEVEASKLPITDAEIERVKGQMRDAEAINERARKVTERKSLEKELDDVMGESDALTKQIDEIDARKKAALEAAKWPVDGLSFDGDTLLFRGVPFVQASQAEKLRVSVAMGLALNPKLRVLLVRDASLLDEKSLALVADMAAEADAQVWLEVVGKEGAGIVIEDGEVESVNAEEEAPI